MVIDLVELTGTRQVWDLLSSRDTFLSMGDREGQRKNQEKSLNSRLGITLHSELRQLGINDVAYTSSLRPAANPPENLTLWLTLLGFKSDLPLLKRVNDHFKTMVLAEGSALEHSVAITLYFATIASTIVFHGRKITQHNFDDLRSAFSALSSQDWMTTELSWLFRQSAELCDDTFRREVNTLRIRQPA